jgi:hypothetical protein
VGSTGQRESERSRRETTPTGLAHRAAGGRERAGGRSGASARARIGLSWANWAELGFSIFREFLKFFLFIFSRVFNSNSN